MEAGHHGQADESDDGSDDEDGLSHH